MTIVSAMLFRFYTVIISSWFYAGWNINDHNNQGTEFPAKLIDIINTSLTLLITIDAYKSVERDLLYKLDN